MTERIEVLPMSGALGARILGVDLCHVDDDTFSQIHAALLRYQVISFAGQTLTPKDQLALGHRFGEPAHYPFAQGLRQEPLITEIVKEAGEAINFGGEWHSDTTYLPQPPKLTMLYAKETPATGGDTLFANMYLAYEQLSGGMRSMLDGMRAVFTAGLLPREKRDGYETMQGINVDKLSMSAEHPVVRRHPETDRCSLFINETHTLNFKNMTREESLPLIQYLCKHAVQPQRCCRLRWLPGTLTVWDNRCTQHFAINDYHGQRRVMHRLIIAGDEPR